MDMSIFSDPGVQKTLGNVASSVLGKPNITSSQSSGYYDGGNYTVNFGGGSKGTNFNNSQTQDKPAPGIAGGMDATTVALLALGLAAVLLVMKKKG